MSRLGLTVLLAFLLVLAAVYADAVFMYLRDGAQHFDIIKS